MKKVLMVLIVVSILSVGMISCEPVRETRIDPITLLPITDDGSIVTADQNAEIPTVEFPANPNINPTDTQSEIMKKLENVVWLNPGTVEITNLYSGAKGEYYLQVHNPKTTTSSFSIYRKNPTSVREGFTRLPEQYYDWVIISTPTIDIPAQSISTILITIKMPDKDKVTGKKYETWIGVMDNSQTGMVRTEICSRWMITTE